MSQETLLSQLLLNLRPKKALHIGASFGQEAELYQHFGIEAWHIEAIPEVFISLKKNLQNLNGQHPVHACLSRDAGLTTSFNVANNEGLSSSLLPLGRHKSEYPSITYEREISVTTESVDSLIQKGIIDPDIDFLLIDAQGAEKLILEGASNFLAQRSLIAAVVETAVVPLYEGGSTYLEVAKILRKHDLHLREAVFGDHGWTDAIFMKPYWFSANPPTATKIDSKFNDQPGQEEVQNIDSEANSEEDYKFLLTNESYIADKTTFCPWDKPSFDQDIKDAIHLLLPTGCAHELIRIGGVGDGAYLVPNDLSAIDACFSPGIANVITFEQELADVYGIHSYMCDASVDAAQLDLNPVFHHFVKKWLGGFDGADTHTLDGWVAETAHSESSNLLLQMDIEGAEFESIIATSESIISQFRIIVIEFHGLWRIQSSRFLNTRFLPVLHKLARHFDCVHAHPNNCCGTTLVSEFYVPNVIELTYYRKSCNSNLFQPQIPHPLDILNVLENPPIQLGAPWSRRN
jgi:FkbM family methyltransferase